METGISRDRFITKAFRLHPTAFIKTGLMHLLNIFINKRNI